MFLPLFRRIHASRVPAWMSLLCVYSVALPSAAGVAPLSPRVLKPKPQKSPTQALSWACDVGRSPKVNPILFRLLRIGKLARAIRSSDQKEDPAQFGPSNSGEEGGSDSETSAVPHRNSRICAHAPRRPWNFFVRFPHQGSSGWGFLADISTLNASVLFLAVVVV